jgi:hypothetical protein
MFLISKEMRLKKDLYPQEQMNVKMDLVKILGLHQDPSIVLYEIDRNTQLLNKIQSLVPLIRKYFSYRTIPGVMEPYRYNRPYLSIIKNLLKDDFSIQCKYIKFRLPDGNRVRTTKYIFSPK